MADAESQDPRLKVAFDLAVAALASQEQVLDALRNRTGILIAAASLASSFLGAQALDESSVSCGWNLLALISLAVVAASAIYVLWPYRNWKFSVDANELIADYIETEDASTIDGLYRNLALHLANSRDSNEQELNRRFVGFQVCSVALLAEVLFWLLSLGT